MKLKVVLEKGEDGYIVASVPALSGCVSQGKTEKDAIKNIKEAILLYLEIDPENIRPDAAHKILRLAI